MNGTRHLNNDEIRRISAAFTGTYEIRNRGLFMIGVSTGGRISELLSLQIADVYQNDRPVTGELHTTTLLGSALKKEADETLFLKLARRGYDLSKLRNTQDNVEVTEIVKIG